jgi:hypothetical protein
VGIVLKLPKAQVEGPAQDPQQPPPIREKPTKEQCAEIRAFLDRKAPYEHPLRIRRHRTWRKADLYLQSVQHLIPSYNTDVTRTVHWTERLFRPDDPNAVPLPVYNEMAARIQNEAARLGRPEYKPYVRPTGENPNAKTKEAAKFSGNLLVAQLDEMKWATRVAAPGHLHGPLYGAWILKSWWDVSLEKPVRIPKKGTARCPECDFKTAGQELDEEGFTAVDQKFPGKVTRKKRPDTPDVEDYSVDHCLTCEDHGEEETVDQPAMDEMGMPMLDELGQPVMTPVTQTVRKPGPPALEAYTPIDQELYEQDSFGRDLGEDVGLGEWRCKTVSPYDLFGENLWIDVDPTEWKEIAEVHVESLDWIRARFPEKATLVKTENVDALLRWHPIGGERAVFYGSAGASGLFKNHCRVKEYHKKPFMEWDGEAWRLNKGRSIMMAGDVVLLDGPFLLESKVNPGTFIPRVHYDYAAWELRSGGREGDGFAMSELLFDPQDNINECKSQTQDTRQRMSVPKFRVTRGMNFDFEQTGNAGSNYVWTPDDQYPGATPEEIGSTTISEGVAKEVERDQQYMDDAAGTSDTEFGNIPPKVSSGTMLQISAEQSGERRRPRIARIREMLERTWKHGLILMHEFVREPRTLQMKDETSEFRDKSWTGLDLMGQTDVHIDAEPEHDSPLQQKEDAREAVTLGLFDPATMSRKARIDFAKKLNVSAELTEDDDLQYECAEREFWEYVDSGHVPVVDEDLDDHEAHDQRHGVDCLSDKWKTKEREAGWDEALVWISGWDKVDPMASMDPLTGQPLPMASWQKIEKAFGQQWPPLLELRIFEAWKIFLQLGGFRPKNPQALEEVMRFRAHRAAHRMLHQQRAQQAQAGMAVPAAPEATTTAAGTMPNPQQQPPVAA